MDNFVKKTLECSFIYYALTYNSNKAMLDKKQGCRI